MYNMAKEIANKTKVNNNQTTSSMLIVICMCVALLLVIGYAAFNDTKVTYSASTAEASSCYTCTSFQGAVYFEQGTTISQYGECTAVGNDQYYSIRQTNGDGCYTAKIDAYRYARENARAYGQEVNCGDKLYVTECGASGDKSICTVTSINDTNVSEQTRVYRENIAEYKQACSSDDDDDNNNNNNNNDDDNNNNNNNDDDNNNNNNNNDDDNNNNGGSTTTSIGERCYNNPSTGTGEWVEVNTCDDNGNAGYCETSVGTVARKYITESYGCEIGERCYNNPSTGKGEWINVIKCDDNGNAGYCQTSAGTIARKYITVSYGCEIGKRCYNNPSTGKGEWINVIKCDDNGNAGYCQTSAGTLARKYITISSGCSSGDAPSNPTTGSTMIYVVWIVAIAMAGYSAWYFKQTKKSQ